MNDVLNPQGRVANNSPKPAKENGDLISRKAVRFVEMDGKPEHPTFNLDDAYERGFEDCLEKVLAMPSVEPEQKHGEWIGTEFDGYADGNPVYYEWKCSACGYLIEDEEPTWNFCPNCGADMRGDQDG